VGTHSSATETTPGARDGVWSKEFVRLWSSSALANLGDGVTLIALPWLAALVTRDPIAIALVAVAGRTPWLLFSIPVGVLIDTTDRRALLMGSEVLRILVFAGIGVAIVLDLVTLPLIVAVAFVLGCLEVGYDSTAQTYLPAIVRSRHLTAANGQLRSVELVANDLAGKPLGGLLVGSLPASAFFFRTVSSLLGLLLLLGLPSDRPPAGSADSSGAGWRFALAGLRALWRERDVRTYTLLVMTTNVALSLVVSTQVLWVAETLGVGAVGYGILLGVSAVGGVLGGQLVGPLSRRMSPGGLVTTGVALLAAACAGIALTRSPVIAGTLYVLSSFAIVVVSVVSVTARQTIIKGATLGRANSGARLLTWSLTPLAFFSGGLVVDVADGPIATELALRLPYAIAAGVLAVAAIIAARALRRPVVAS
jgi:MFS family permease